MEENRKHIDKLFQEELGNYTETPSPAVWEALETRLDAHYAPNTKANSELPVRSYRWIWYALATALVAVVLYYIISGAVKHSDLPATNNESSYIETPVPSTSSTSTHITPIATTIDAAKGNENAGDSKYVKDNKAVTTSTPGSKAKVNTTLANKQQLTAGAHTQAPATATAGNIQTVKERSGTSANNTADGNISSRSSSSGKGKKYPTATNSAKGTGATKIPATNKTAFLGKKSSGIGTAKNNADKTTANTATVAKRGNNPSGSNSRNTAQQKLPVSVTPATKAGNKNVAAANNASAESAAKKANDEQTNPISTSASAANTKPLTKNNNANKGSKKASSNSGEPETHNTTANEKLATGSRSKIDTTQPVSGSGSIKTRNNYSGGNPAKPAKKTSSNTAQKKSGTAGSTSSGNTPVAKKNTKSSNKSTNSSEEADNTTDVSFDNTIGNKNKKEPEVAKADEKPKINWQKGFDADNSRGLKDLSAGKQAGNEGNDARPVEDTKAAASGGGGGATAGIDEKSKKKKKDKSGTSNKPFDFGAKLGFEKGFGSYQANKLVFAPYLQYKLASNISLIAQPTIKYSMINKTALEDPQSYYRAGSSSLDSNHTIKKAVDTFAEDTITRRYYVSQLYDSIVVARSIKQKSYIEFELPVLLQFKIGKSFAPYVGLTLSYSTIVNSADDQKTYSGITRSDSIIYAPVPKSAPAPATPNPGSSFQYNGTPFSQYTPGPSSTPSSMFRFSYSVGFNYLVNNRLFFDLMYTKTFSNLTGIQDTRIREIYNQGYLRFSIGYRLGK